MDFLQIWKTYSKGTYILWLSGFKSGLTCTVGSFKQFLQKVKNNINMFTFHRVVNRGNVENYTSSRLLRTHDKNCILASLAALWRTALNKSWQKKLDPVQALCLMLVALPFPFKEKAAAACSNQPYTAQTIALLPFQRSRLPTVAGGLSLSWAEQFSCLDCWFPGISASPVLV